MIKRLRIFAGPNGSGKTTLKNQIASIVDLGVYVNADDIQAQIARTSIVDLKEFQIYSSKKSFTTQFVAFCTAHGLNKKVENKIDYMSIRFVKSQLILPKGDYSGYLAAIIADFIRHKLVEQGVNFSFETVMSDESKIRFLKDAKDNGYRIYLYFVCTDDPITNVGRVKERTQNNGHDVSFDKIVGRYPRSLQSCLDR